MDFIDDEKFGDTWIEAAWFLLASLKPDLTWVKYVIFCARLIFQENF